MSERNGHTYVEHITEAIQVCDRPRVSVLCRALIDELRASQLILSEDDSRSILNKLRDARHFREMSLTADAILRHHPDNVFAHTPYAQALIELGLLTAAADHLRDALEHDQNLGREKAELQGLLGRVHKQIYFDEWETSGAPPMSTTELEQALGHYGKAYHEAPDKYWHGINLASLLSRFEQDTRSEAETTAASVAWQGKRAVEIANDVRSVAESIIATKSATPEAEPDPWAFATAAEAAIIAGDFPAAARAVAKYVESKHTTAFHVASTLRQFTEVLRLDSTHEDHVTVLAPLEKGLLEKHGGRLEHRPGDLLRRAGHLSRGSNKDYDWMKDALTRAQAVGRIWFKGGMGLGTGFVIASEDLGLPNPQKLPKHVFLTNYHVLNKTGADGAMPHGEAVVTFDALYESDEEPPQYEVEVRYQSNKEDLDLAVATLKRDGTIVNEVERLDHPIRITAPRNLAAKEQIYVIGHPRGGPLQYALYANRFVGIGPDESANGQLRIQYYTPTEEGNSGSPVFDSKWNLIGIHHRGGYLPGLKFPHSRQWVNQGVPIEPILEFIFEKASKA